MYVLTTIEHKSGSNTYGLEKVTAGTKGTDADGNPIIDVKIEDWYSDWKNGSTTTETITGNDCADGGDGAAPAAVGERLL